MLLKSILFSVLAFHSLSGEQKSSPSIPQSNLRHLKKVLKKYHNQHMLMEVEKTSRIPLLNKTQKEQGLFYLSQTKFRFQMKKPRRSLIVFDGKNLWHQEDLEKNIVFKFETNHPYFYLFSSLFNFNHFFKTFQVIQINKKGSLSIYKLKPLKKMEGIKAMSITVANHIQQLDIAWEDLDNSQSYRFHKLFFKKRMSQGLFRFKETDFKILQKN